MAPLCGRPLLEYTCEAALRSRFLSRVMLSTDDEEIAEVARAAGVDVPFRRPDALAADDTTHVDVVAHALTWLHEHEGYRPDVVVVLQPTSPLRQAAHIDQALLLLEEHEADSVVSTVRVPHQFAPLSLMRRDADGFVHPLTEGPMILRRQDKSSLFARNGPAVLVTRASVVTGGALYGPRVWGMEMSVAESVDIDGPEDMDLAEFWLKKRSAEVGEGRAPWR